MSVSDPVRLADKLSRLFATVHAGSGGNPGDRERSSEHVVSEIGKLRRVSISQSYIWKLRKGKKDNPTLRHQQAMDSLEVVYRFEQAERGVGPGQA